MNRKELVEGILEDKSLSHMTKKEADHFVATMLDVIRKSVKRGEDVSLIGFGTFSKARRAARIFKKNQRLTSEENLTKFFNLKQI